MQKLKEFFKKIQNLPESQRKIILWLIIVIISLGLFIWWGKNVQLKIKSFRGEELKGLPKIEIPEIEIPEASKEELKKLEEMMKGAQ